MSSEILGLREPREPKPGREAARPSAPPFRRRSSHRSPTRTPVPARAFSGLSRGGTVDALTGGSRRQRMTGAGVSALFHLLLFALLLGGLVPTAVTDQLITEAVEEEEQDSLLYTFEAPPLQEEVALAEVVPIPEPEEPAPDAPAAPEPSPPPQAPLVIPKAQIATPNTGFQNDLPFSDGQDEEFYMDHEMGEDFESEFDESASETETEVADIPLPESDNPQAEDTRLADASSAESPPPLLFDAEAFRDRINDPAADVRRRGDEMARSKARALAEAERRKRGGATDIWRFLDGKRFRNPEGGLVSNRNNTLYYDDRGANLVPWIARLIAEVRRNWFIPYAASYERGHVAIAISVLRSGEIAWLQVVIPSGVAGFDNAAVGALRSARLLPLPDDYPGADFEMMLVFWYNEQPYDLFSQ